MIWKCLMSLCLVLLSWLLVDLRCYVYQIKWFILVHGLLIQIYLSIDFSSTKSECSLNESIILLAYTFCIEFTITLCHFSIHSMFGFIFMCLPDLRWYVQVDSRSKCTWPNISKMLDLFGQYSIFINVKIMIRHRQYSNR